MSAVRNNPALRHDQRFELFYYRTAGISESTFALCRELTSKMQGCDITMMCTEDAPLKRVYLKHPTRENWLALELEVFIDTGEGFGLNVEALH